MAHIFDEDPITKLHSKAWKGYFVGYEGKNQYRIYDPARRQVFVRRDVSLHEDTIGPSGKPSTTDRLIRHNEGNEHVNFPVLGCMTVNGYQQQFHFSPVITENVNPVQEMHTPDSDSDSLTELGDTEHSSPDFTGSSAPQASTYRTPRNVKRINYQKAHIGRASLSKTNSSVPINSPH